MRVFVFAYVCTRASRCGESVRPRSCATISVLRGARGRQGAVADTAPLPDYIRLCIYSFTPIVKQCRNAATLEWLLPSS